MILLILSCFYPHNSEDECRNLFITKEHEGGRQYCLHQFGLHTSVQSQEALRSVGKSWTGFQHLRLNNFTNIYLKISSNHSFYLKLSYNLKWYYRNTTKLLFYWDSVKFVLYFFGKIQELACFFVTCVFVVQFHYFYIIKIFLMHNCERQHIATKIYDIHVQH